MVEKASSSVEDVDAGLRTKGRGHDARAPSESSIILRVQFAARWRSGFCSALLSTVRATASVAKARGDSPSKVRARSAARCMSWLASLVKMSVRSNDCALLEDIIVMFFDWKRVL